MTVNMPRRTMDWIQPAAMIVFASIVGYGANGVSSGITSLKADVESLSGKMADMNIKMARLETTIQMGMGDRFTGEQGKALIERVQVLESRSIQAHNRLGALEVFCAELMGSHGGNKDASPRVKP